MSGVITTGSAPRLLQMGVNAVFDNANKQWEPIYPKLFEVMTADKGAYELDIQMSNMGLASAKAEGDDIAMDSLANCLPLSMCMLHMVKALLLLVKLKMTTNTTTTARVRRRWLVA